VLIKADPHLSRIDLGSVPDDWAVRAVFFHPHSARIWRGRSASGKRETRDELLDSYRSALAASGLTWDTFVSLGAGGGSVDREIAAALTGTRHYVPVDISWSICGLSVLSLEDLIPVPFGIVSDFEDRFDFIAQALRPFEGTRVLFCCTGNAIGNLDRGEAKFFANLRGLMKPTDNFLLSVATGSFGGDIGRSEIFDQNVSWEALRPLLACSRSAFSGEDVAEAEAAIERHVVARPGTSDVDGARTAAFRDESSGRLLLQMRRYDLPTLGSWLETQFGYQVLHESNIALGPVGLGTGTLLLGVK
jgi:hypothetical protein